MRPTVHRVTTPTKPKRKADSRESETPASELPTLEELTKDDLYQMAQDADIPGRSSMSKNELIAALQDS